MPLSNVHRRMGSTEVMRAVVQRVSRARVTVEARSVGQIERGLMVLLGVGTGDGQSDAEYLAEKIAALRIFEDADGKMNRNVSEAGRRGAGGEPVHAVRRCAARQTALV